MCGPVSTWLNWGPPNGLLMPRNLGLRLLSMSRRHFMLLRRDDKNAVCALCWTPQEGE